MNWIVFSYSLPSQSRSSPRVTLWRRLKRLGAISLAGGPQILPERDDCIEAFSWLAQEIRQAGGEAVVMHVQQFAGLTDTAVIQLFQTARRADYEELDHEAAALEQELESKDYASITDALERLRRRYADITRIDYFQCPSRAQLVARLARIEQALSPHSAGYAVTAVSAETYHDKRWVTRPHPHVDRLACIWLIRRFIDPQASIRYAPAPEPGEIAFDMDQGEFGHRGNLCTFEMMRLAFGLDDPGLRAIAEIVHEIDLQDGRFARPETAGIAAVLDGWRQAKLDDAALETQGVALFEGLHTALSLDSS